MSGSSSFSRLYDPLMVLPDTLGLRRLREKTLRGLRGRVLELGIGTGRNIPLYPPALGSLVGVDPDEVMLRKAGKRAREASFPVELIPASAEGLPFENESFDAVVATLAFCTIPEPEKALSETRRVLKTGGEFRLLEHVKMEHEPVAWLQEKVTPLWKHLAGGCHLDRDTLVAVREAGFDAERVERHLDGLVVIISARDPEGGMATVRQPEGERGAHR
jgi:ubiquinone/menaquinone biosynthesis C-methylase UbiE